MIVIPIAVGPRGIPRKNGNRQDLSIAKID